MEADARTLLTLVGPLAIMYMTYSSVQSTVANVKDMKLKAVTLTQIGAAPELPSAEAKLRNPFVPASGTGGGEVVAEDGEAADPEKSDEPLRLDGTAMIGKIRFAIINGVRVTEGDYFRGMRLVKVDATQVTLTGDSEQVVLPLEIAKSDTIQVISPAAIARDTGATVAKPAGQRSGDTGRPLPAQAAKTGATGATGR